MSLRPLAPVASLRQMGRARVGARSMRRFLIPAGLCSLVLVGVGAAAPLPKADPRAGLSDSFDGKLSLDWKVVRPDPTHVSLKKVPGAMVITTQRESIHGRESADQLSGGLHTTKSHLI